MTAAPVLQRPNQTSTTPTTSSPLTRLTLFRGLPGRAPEFVGRTILSRSVLTHWR
jgi:hypothetical protein